VGRKALIISFAIVTLISSLAILPAPALAVGAGILPTSPFYVFDGLSESFKLFFARDPLTRARLQLEFGEERIMECDALPTTSEKELWCPRLMRDYEARVNSALAILNSTRNFNANVSGIVEAATSRHVQVLRGLLESNATPAIARPALERALNVSQLGQPAATSLRRVLIEEASRAVESPEFQSRLSGIVENATATGNFTAEAREQLRTAVRDEVTSAVRDAEGVIVDRIERYIRERGTTDIRGILEAFRIGVESRINTTSPASPAP